MASASEQTPINGAVEGMVDDVVLRRLLDEVGAVAGAIHVKNGKGALLQRLQGFNSAARHTPWVVLVDLDRDTDCAPPFRDNWLPHPATMMCFRVAVRAVEAWLLADRERIAAFMGVSESVVPAAPEAEDDPKAAMIGLARRSRRREIRMDMVPRPASGRRVGPAYPSRLVEFVTDTESGWRPEVAARRCDSLRRCLGRIAELAAGDEEEE
jgi:hypothetical protein